MLPAPRVNWLADLHEGLRKLVSERTAVVARTDFRNEIAHIVVCSGIDACLLILREHADHHGIVVAPVLAALDCELAGEARRRVQALEQCMHEVERACTRLRFSASYEWPALGRELRRRFEAFAEAQQAHAAFEEKELQPLLWREKSDQELLGMRAATRALLTPARRLAWDALRTPSAESRVPLVA